MRKLFLLLAVLAFAARLPAADEKADKNEPVSYYKQIRPIFQANCQGCHQPAKARGEYVMTSYERLLKGGDSGEAAIVKNKAAASHLVKQIEPKDGVAKMPEGKKPLDRSDIDLIRRWIDQGASDDTPASAVAKYDAEHPPVYTRASIVPSLDYSPDGKTLAVAGFHEVLLLDAETDKIAGRLIGISERIECVRYSPDGKSLAVSGGLPGRMGEIQVWDVAKKKLRLSVPVTFDTLYGLSWSPDGTQLAFGCTDNSVRVIDAVKGEQILFQGGHADWVLASIFTTDNKNVVSASRDMSVKLTEIATQRLIDNITSITPNALKGGIQALARHPKVDVFVAGGSDGVPRVYRVFREAARQIGDDANHVADLYPMIGRVFSIRWTGNTIAAASSLDGKGEVSIVKYDYDADVPAPLKGIMGKVPGSRNPQERKALDDYKNNGMKEIARIKVDSGVYALAIRPDTKTVAAAGGDGKVRLFEVGTGKLVREFYPIESHAAVAKDQANPKLTFPKDEPVADVKLPAGAKVVSIEVEPKSIELADPYAYAQVLVTAKLSNGNTFDATRLAKLQADAKVEITPTGLVRPRTDGQTELRIELDGQSATVPVKVAGIQAAFHADFIHDVNPVLGRLGCNQGTCHGANKGKNGFKLSLRGVDPVFDVRAFLDDLAGRRANVASPDDSLMLLKATGAVPHFGGQLTKPGEPKYEIIRNWIARGAQLDLKTPRTKNIEIRPASPIAQRVGDKQQFRVVATYTDGTTKDVTREAYIESGNLDIASADKTGLLTPLRRGEVPILARFDGAYTATTLLVMGDRSEFVWTEPPAFNKIDELTAAKWKRMKTLPSELAGDLEFLRRVHLDLTGTPPTSDEVRKFAADPTDSRKKREAVIDRLIGSPEYVDYWSNKWSDLLMVNRKYLGNDGAKLFHDWIRKEVDANTPYDEFARKILTATGSNKANPPASYYKVLREPTAIMENTTHLFLGVRFNCNKCHDHPFERWTQDQYYQTAAYFARVGLQADPDSKGAMVGGTAVEGGKPLYEKVVDNSGGEVKHDRTGQVTAPKFPFPAKHAEAAKATRREELAAWISSPDNQYFARSMVNRTWGYLFGVGIIDPIDDIRAGNPPTNPELLDYLTKEFVQSGFNIRHIQKLIVSSRTYQLSVVANRWNMDDKVNYSHALPRRLPAEALYDTLLRVTGSAGKLGMHASALPDSGVDLSTGFLATFGRPTRDSACECERRSELQLGPIMAMVNGQTLAEAIGDPNNGIAKLVAAENDDAKVVDELFFRILNRPATAKETAECLAVFGEIDTDNTKLIALMKEREKAAAESKEKREKERTEAIAKAKADFEAYEKEIAPKIAAAEKVRQAGIAAAQAEVKKYEAIFADKIAEWEKKQKLDVVWHSPKAEKAEGPKDVKLHVQEDASITADGKAGRDTYTVTFDSDLPAITALRLEMIADPKQPHGGPGRAPDGNFVLTEITVDAQAKGTKDLPKRFKLIEPHADFNQKNFEVKYAVDGDEGSRDKGWAVSPAFGSTHWATFRLKEPIAFEKGAKITVKLISQYQGPAYVPGRFRISFATEKNPVGLSIAEDYRSILTTPADKRTQAQKDVLTKYFRGVDDELRKLQEKVGTASAPLPADPRLTELKSTIDEASKPVREDERLAQLRADVAASGQLLTNRRLTAAQDIAWALINSPAFLFNH